MFCGPEGRKVGSLKRWVWRHLAGSTKEMKNCTWLRREALICTKHIRFGAFLEVELLKNCCCETWDVWRGSAKLRFAWQAQYTRHFYQRCLDVKALISWDRLHLGAVDDFAQVQNFVWPGLTEMEWKNSKTNWYEVVSSAPNFPL